MAKFNPHAATKKATTANPTIAANTMTTKSRNVMAVLYLRKDTLFESKQ